MSTVENAATWFNAKTVAYRLDVVDCQAASIVDTRTDEGLTVRFYNVDGFEFVTLKSDDVSTRFEPLFGEKLVGARKTVGFTPRTKPTTCFKHDTTRNPVLGSAERKEKRA